MDVQASIQQEKLDVQKARAEHETAVQQHRDHVTEMNSQVDRWKVGYWQTVDSFSCYFCTCYEVFAVVYSSY